MPKKTENPFTYESASRLPLDELLDVYIPDYNYSRFFQSKRNLIVLGDRGSGKTSTLLHNSLQASILRSRRDGSRPDLSILGIYIPGNSTHVAKRDFELLPEVDAKIVAEHYLCSLIASQIVSSIEDLDGVEDCDDARNELEYVMGWDLIPDLPLRKALGLYLKKLSYAAQTQANNDGLNVPKSPMSFSSTIVFLVQLLRQLPGLENSHFSLMIDDVQNLNDYHRRVLNSWISYRYTEEISIKIAAAKSSDITYRTDEGGAILEGHDYTLIDLENPFQASESSFYRLAKDIVERRLKIVGRVDLTAEDFFPCSAAVSAALDRSNELVRSRYLEANPDANEKQVRDHVYKYGRAEMFRARADKANLPSYSGFDVIAHVSTGVIRNLLQPCYWMYEDALSRNGGRDDFIIDPEIQDSTLKKLSEELWTRLERDVALTVPGCTRDQARRLYQLFNNLAKLFRDRLAHHKSEPRAIVFSVSGTKDGIPDSLQELFRIAREFQVLYIRRGSAKEEGERETYYVPNRLLWPIKGLDPVGQHSRVSLKIGDIIAAAEGKPFPSVEDKYGLEQLSLPEE